MGEAKGHNTNKHGYMQRNDEKQWGLREKQIISYKGVKICS